MSGHSKWSQIKHKKAATDAKRSKVFGKLANLIAIESKRVGGDANAASLRTIIDKAKSLNMPKDNIERAVAKGKSGDVAALEPLMYEGFGPSGVAILVDTLTDSRNRTNQELKHLFSLHEASLGAPGSAAWAFTKEGDEWRPVTTVDIDERAADTLSALVDALEERDDVQEVCTNAA